METAIIYVIFWTLIGCFCGYIAQKRGRDYVIWFFIGMLLGIIGLIVLLVLPPVKPTEVEEVTKELPPSPLRQVDWFYLDLDHNQIGPLSFEQLAKAWRDGKIGESRYVWSEGMENWMTIKDQPDLMFQLKDI